MTLQRPLRPSCRQPEIAMAHSIRPTASRPQLPRIAGLSLAITLNTGLLLLLLVPMRAPPVAPIPTVTQVIQWIRPKPVIPPKPEEVPVQKKQPSRQSAVRSRPADPPRETPPVVMETGTLPPLDPVIDPPPVIEIGGGKPQPGVRLQYDRAPAPSYPRDALREGVQGTVLLQVLVDVDGRPLKVDVQRSSGDRRLDLAARRQVLANWRFRPAIRDGRAVQAIGIVPIDFHLGN
jgi:protein TonB